MLLPLLVHQKTLHASPAYRVPIGRRARRARLSSHEFQCVFMPSHATWADSLGWSSSPMRGEAGLSSATIESSAERGKKESCDRVIGVQNNSPPLPPPRTQDRAETERSYVTTTALHEHQRGCGFLWVPQIGFCWPEYHVSVVTCKRWPHYVVRTAS